MSDPKPLRIVQAATEFAPLIEAGHLAYSVGGLARALVQQGHEVTVALPGYPDVMADLGLNSRAPDHEVIVPMGLRYEQGEVYLSESDGIDFLVIARDEYFDRRFPYGPPHRSYDDNGSRFLFFAKALGEALCRRRRPLDILHVHDWTTALAPLYLRMAEINRGVDIEARSVLTIHHAAYQGIFDADLFNLANLPPSFFSPELFEFYGQINFLKGGITCADAIVTASPTYRGDLLGDEAAFGLEGILQEHQSRLYGILDGLEEIPWNPRRDPVLFANFDAGDIESRGQNRTALLEDCGITGSFRGPLFCADDPESEDGSRAFAAALFDFIESADAHLMIVNCTTRSRREYWHQFTGKRPGRVTLVDQCGSAALRRTLAGCDYYIKLSRWEPDSIGLMGALRYGCLPIGSDRAAVVDTVDDLRELPDHGNGFTFSWTPDSFVDALGAARKLFADSQALDQARKRAIESDFSWRKPVNAYTALFETTL